MRIYEDLRVVQTRLAVLQALVVALVGVLVLQFWNLQVLRARHFRDLAENNRSRLVTLAAPRGALLDRHGQVLVGNRPSFNVVLNPEHAGDLDQVVSRLAGALGMGEAAIRERLARRPALPAGGREDGRDARRRGCPRRAPAGAARGERRGGSAALLSARLRRGPRPRAGGRDHGAPAPARRVPGPRPGVARRPGGSRVPLQPRPDGPGRLPPRDREQPRAGGGGGRAAGPEDGPEPHPEHRRRRCRRPWRGPSRAGPARAVALDPRTGEILAMASTPAYDPNEFTTGIDAALWASLATDPRDPAHEPGHPGRLLAGQHVQDHRRDGRPRGGRHHALDHLLLPGLPRRLQHGLPLHRQGRPRRHGPAPRDREFVQRLLLPGRDPPRDRAALEMGEAHGPGRARPASTCPTRLGGLMPSPEWKMRVFKTPWYAGETVSVAIGQGQVSATPLQMARVAAVDRERRTSRAAPPGPAAPGGPASTGHPPGDDRCRQGGPAGGGGRGHGTAGAAPHASRCAARRARRRWWRARASRSRRTPSSCFPTAGSWPLPPPTIRGSPSPCSSSTAGSGAESARPGGPADPRPLLRARSDGGPRPPGVPRARPTEAED